MYLRLLLIVLVRPWAAAGKRRERGVGLVAGRTEGREAAAGTWPVPQLNLSSNRRPAARIRLDAAMGQPCTCN